ncbi:MAG TPA: amidase family protein [Solirubrobacteraceae bacterium]|nr:amidase family protein [Solirubrobacteraceae bacterium]
MTSTADQDLAFAGPAALAAAVRAREVTPRELVELYLRRIERIDPKLNAFRTVMADEALATADRMGEGDAGDAGSLAGVPVAVKDDQPVKGQPLTFGSRATDQTPQAADAEVVRRLRAAGAIPIGITNVPELMIFPWTATDANGITRNPWDPSRTPGGSSGGSGAAVAAGLVAAATGSDGAGSIRIPAACCGLVGMKASRGRVSMQPFGEGWLGLSTFGALARTVADSALLLDVLQEASPEDRYRLPPAAESFSAAATREPKRLRIAVSRKVPNGLIAPLSADQRLAFDRTARLLGELGHHVEERDPAYGLLSLEFAQTWIAGIDQEFSQLVRPQLAEASTRQMAAAGRRLVPPRRREALRTRREEKIRRVLSLWDEVDVLLTPGLSRTALPAEGGYNRAAPVAFDRAARFTPYTPVFNLTGQPAISLPAGRGSDGLPLSVQLAGRIGDEATLYSLAAEIEAARPWASERPPLATI